MKLLLLIDSLGSGGAQNQLSLLAVALKKAGHEVSVFTYFPANFFAFRLEENQIPLHFVAKRGKLGANVIRSLGKLYDREKFDSVLAYLHTPNLYACLASKLASHRPRIVIGYRSKTNFKKLPFLRRKMLTWVNGNADAIVANSHHERIAWQEHAPKHAAKWQTIYNIVDLKTLTPTEQEDKFKSKFICIGNVRPLKNADLLVEALYLMKQRGLELPIVHWYGKRDYTQAAFAKSLYRLMEKVERYELENYLKWKMPRPDVTALLGHYRALIHPSLLEGLPNVICEALAAGVPVLASDILDHPRLVSEGERGYLFSPKQAPALATAIQKMMEMKESDYIRMQEACRTYAEEYFAGEGVVSEYEEILS